ncbi:MAG TPA: BMP family ABC transporter substrate-binding protein [Nocardioides sp.]|uniref:BMP family lipoprotein n=1 Tax=Nocardioides sp. TaxID=35761 RepID=UPI002F42F74B
MRHPLKIVIALGAASLLIAGCGKPSSSNATDEPSSSGQTSSGGTSTGSLKACMVLDTGGVDDKSFNQSSWAGMTAAKAANSNISVSYVPSGSQNDYTPNLTAETNKGCDTVIAVGGLMYQAVAKIAKKNPSQHYAEIDSSNQGLKNVYGLQYNTAQGGFLGGYLAAGMSKTGKVATYGGLNIPPVTIYMDGFWEGVQYYNKQKGTNVQVLGWDETNQKGGTFANSFTDANKGKQITQQFQQQGADIVFPVAGGTGVGSAAAAAASGGKLNVIWVDTDGCESVSNYCKYFITSVTKNLTDSVTEYVEKAASGTFPKGNYIGTLENDGTGLAPFHDWDSTVPSALKSALDQVQQDIISGKIKITSPSQPQ